ncbi:MAG: B12-binding domain-containing radical SAM protein [Acidobacteriota bacterium]
MRVLLLNPPFPSFPDEPRYANPPLGLAYLAAVLERQGHEVRILDAVLEGYTTTSDYGGVSAYGLSSGEIVAKVVSYRPDVVGLSCLFTTMSTIVRTLAVALRAACPAARIVLGGAHATALAEELVQEPPVDFVIRGEGEQALLELLEHLAGQRPVEAVSNLTWMDGEPRSTPQRFLDDLDRLPMPARHLLDLEGYMRIGRMQGLPGRRARATTMITSRGCSGRCVFCSIHSVWGRTFRAHSPEYVLAEMRELRERYGVDHLIVEDDNLTLDRTRAEAIFAGMIESRLDLSWTAPNGVAIWALDEDLLRLMKAAGCRWVFLAVESGDAHTLTKIIKKPLRLDRVETIVSACRRLGLRTTAFFVVGCPGETMEAIRRSMRYAENLDVDSISIAIAAPYPGTELHRICLTNGYLVEGFRPDHLMVRCGQIRTPDFGPEDLQRLIGSTHLRHALKHPYGTMLRLADKVAASPSATLLFVARRLGRTLRSALDLTKR